jgi:Tfp pilus assembly protein PilN
MKNPFAKPDKQYDGSFLPEDYVARRAEARANFLSLVLFAAVMFAVVAAFFVTNRQWITVRNQQRFVTEEFAKAQKKIEQLEELEAQKAEMLEKAEITTALIEKVPRSVLLSELISRMPPEITLLDFVLESKRVAVAKPTPAPTQMTRGSLSRAKNETAEKAPKIQAPQYEYKLVLRGVSANNTHITDYLTSLIDCELLTAVNLEHIKERQISENTMREFEITARIKRGVDARSVTPVEELQQGSRVRSSKELSAAPEDKP